MTFRSGALSVNWSLCEVGVFISDLRLRRREVREGGVDQLDELVCGDGPSQDIDALDEREQLPGDHPCGGRFADLTGVLRSRDRVAQRTVQAREVSRDE